MAAMRSRQYLVETAYRDVDAQKAPFRPPAVRRLGGSSSESGARWEPVGDRRSVRRDELL